MKKLLSILTFIILNTTNSFAFDAVVIVLQAPLLKEPRLNSVVLQTLRKGARVYVPHEIGILLDDSDSGGSLPEFIQTYDRVGNTAYIPTKFIKIITNEISENKMPITLPGSDPTDYRLEEPIPNTYPFDNTSFLRASLSLSMGNNIKAPYDYNSAFTKQTFSSETGASLILSRKMTFDRYDRSYFGFVGAINSSNNKTLFQNLYEATENRSVLKLGPIITYDAFKTEKLRLTLGTGFTYNYHRSTLQVIDGIGGSEQRFFSGFSLAPFTKTMLQISDVFPLTDFLMGADFTLYLPHTQKSTDEITVPELWNLEDPSQIQAGLEPQVSFFLGFQVRY